MNPNRVHPEVHKEVYTKFRELYEKNPQIDGVKLWEMSSNYVWADCLAETEMMRLEYQLQ